jgi:outer membrane protein assembly factor BamB
LNDSVGIFNMSNWTEIGKIQVFPYPTSVAADSAGHVYVLSAYDAAFNPNQNVYPNSPTPGGIVVINDQSDQIESQTVVELAFPQPIAISGNRVYYVTVSNKVAVLDAATRTPITDNFITDGTTVSNASAICVNPATGEVFLASAQPLQPGRVFAFDKAGRLEYSFVTGVNPIRLALLGQ